MSRKKDYKIYKDIVKKEEGRRKKEEGRGKREEGRGKREEGRGKKTYTASFWAIAISHLIKWIYLAI